MSAHDANDDGSWGYGWIKLAQGTNRGLLGVDLAPVKDFTISGARLILWVARNNFRSKANGGTPFALHAFEPSNRGDQWAEGDTRWEQFNICSQTEWVRPAVKVPDYPGATWLCAADPSTSDNFNTDCGTSLRWDPRRAVPEQAADGVPHRDRGQDDRAFRYQRV